MFSHLNIEFDKSIANSNSHRFKEHYVELMEVKFDFRSHGKQKGTA